MERWVSAVQPFFLVECECFAGICCLFGTVSHISFLYLDIPEAPLNVGAIPVLQLFENDCEIAVKWDPPANSVDITHYLVYVPALNMKDTTDSPISSLSLRDCPERFSIKVAAINRFGCIGINSSEVNVTLQPTSESSKYNNIM